MKLQCHPGYCRPPKKVAAKRGSRWQGASPLAKARSNSRTSVRIHRQARLHPPVDAAFQHAGSDAACGQERDRARG